MSKEKNRYSDFEVVREPEVPRKFKLWPHQWIGVPLLLAIPVLAISGVFGDTQEKARVDGDAIELSVVYPRKVRFGKEEEIRVNLRNKTDAPLRDVKVSFDQGYLGAFSRVEFLPGTNQGLEMKFDTLEAGQAREFEVSFEGDEYGSHEGDLRASSGARNLASLHLKSFVFP